MGIDFFNPAKLVLESGSSRQEVKLTDNQNPVKPEVLPSVPESYNLMANGAVAVWDYHLTNYDKAGNVRVYPEKTTFDLDASDDPYGIIARMQKFLKMVRVKLL